MTVSTATVMVSTGVVTVLSTAVRMINTAVVTVSTAVVTVSTAVVTISRTVVIVSTVDRHVRGGKSHPRNSEVVTQKIIQTSFSVMPPSVFSDCFLVIHL